MTEFLALKEMVRGFGISGDSIIVSIVLGLTLWSFKKAFAAGVWALKEIISKLISTITACVTKVEMLDTKLATVISSIGDVHKIRSDLNSFYDRLKSLENEVRNKH